MKIKTLVLIVGLMSGMASQAQFLRIDAKFYSPSLDTVRNIDIYLPPDYFVDSVTYPVIYFLHAANDNQNGANVPASYYYSQAALGKFKPVIMISPDGSCPPYLGSMYVNSLLYGNFYDYILEDVISFTESNFRVIPNKHYRFLTGLSMGAQGSLGFLSDHPEMFRAAFAQQGNPILDSVLNNWKEQIFLENDSSYNFQYGAGTMTNLFFTISGGYAPNLSLPPYFVEPLFDSTGNRVDSVYAKWKSFDIIEKMKNILPADSVAYFITCGTEDEFNFYPSNLGFHDYLEAQGIDHGAWFHPGTHGIYDPGALEAGFSFLDSLIRNGPSLGVNPAEEPRNFMINLHPNPCRDRFTCSFTLNSVSDITFEVWSARGMLVVSNRETGLIPGFHQREYSSESFAPGIYFVTLRADGLVGGTNLVVVK
jgi:S-formylglutathione hydrolase FrmB